MRKRTLLKLGLCLIIIVAGIGAYNARSKTSTNQQSITAVGSTALQPLVEAASEQYSADHAGIFINVQGGGSGTGLSQIETGAVQMGNSDLFAEEKAGINPKGLVDHKIAVVGVAPITNDQVGIKNLTTKQLIAIFTGKITNWRQLGGPNLPVTLINRSQGSGTRVTFEQFGLAGHESATAQEQDSSGTVRQIVSSTPGAISYVSFGYINKSVQPISINGVQPTENNVKNNKWKIWSYEHIYTRGKPTGLTKKFLTYLKNDHIQTTLFNKLGYISVKDMQYQRSWQGKISKGSGE
ncbi:Phosphate-binding protein PstS 1 precursor [Lentilactobacillus parabuchneri]|jgi:phosphate transport system substrate-binding protein|uniref:Phosphate-binding protein n=2 Tax=Lentilactobacillus parabuchneri TaxID=152331 RepID=A0A0R1YXF9_9LACO|nr:phosphate ABC transporter substrate-binding protein PstS family protein [Lentilactobacillus parabuchneri]APR08177.1 Phosphate-binding protein PstS 1 precursor [Lentilactobacillus parabuchneri]KRM46693.1 phosphate binding protein [Lentilactobacillus parabuchneri DSM 5707 = NBRC 107865]KRN76402.1 phosphate binding protein [Lentilactobacillus parabuchneri]MBW0222435.1 phosphate ABC transporter substrate-binding protein PstS family protein [Lentilactobacillus parabuchneri]MBW0244620.1 phosphate